MKQNEAYVGKEYNHPHYGRVFVDSVAENSRTKVNITCIDRGKGWSEKHQDHKGVKSSGVDHKGIKTSQWVRGENKQYLDKDVVHINELS